MKYFISDSERHSTCYHEWQKGCFDGRTFWKKDSLLLSDDILVQLELDILFNISLGNYDPYGETKVSKNQWEVILNKSAEIGGNVAECILEADVWVQDTFKEHKVFTMLGI